MGRCSAFKSYVPYPDRSQPKELHAHGIVCAQSHNDASLTTQTLNPSKIYSEATARAVEENSVSPHPLYPDAHPWLHRLDGYWDPKLTVDITPAVPDHLLDLTLVLEVCERLAGEGAVDL